MLMYCIKDRDTGKFIPLGYLPDDGKKHNYVPESDIDYEQASPMVKLTRNFNLPAFQ